MAAVLQKQEINKQSFSLFIRDLSQTLNINLKHMIEDLIQKPEENKIKDKKNHNKKKQVKKKKDIIIEQQNKIRGKKEIEDDLNKLTFLFDSCDKHDPFKSIDKLKTNEGKVTFKIKLLHYFWKDKKKNLNIIILLYYNLKDETITGEKDKKIFKKIEKIINTHEIKLFMMKEMGNMLPPLNFLEKNMNKFEDWQVETIQKIKDNKSIIVRAPTSSGKSFIAMSSGIFHKKILYVCPAKPVVYQVGAHYTHMGYKVHYLVEGNINYNYDKQTNIFIGTPEYIENEIGKIGIQFDYAVFDEIHNLNNENDGDCYENILKLINCNFLALSATIKNVDFLKDIFNKINPKKEIDYIEYNKRFINHQRWSMKENDIQKIHPLSTYSEINDNFINSKISFTPNDCAILWEKINDIFDEDEDILYECSPDEYFTEDKLLTLNDCKNYECFLKTKLIEWNKKYPNEIKKLLKSFSISDKTIPHNMEHLIKLISTTKKKDLFPMLMFNTSEVVCRDIFYELYDVLNQKELENYPYHYDILEEKQKLYEEYVSKRDSFQSSIKITSTNAMYEIKEKMENHDIQEKQRYIVNVSNIYNRKLNDIKRSDISDKLKTIQTKNILKEKRMFENNPDFNYQDVFKKHKDFIFTKSNEPMSGETIREIRREIKNTLDIKIPYESPLFQLLKRGIGIYIENEPEEYKWILQKLLIKKEIGIVISDKTLCMGIDLPVRTSCFMGISNRFTKEEYLQMSGRAGRRGMDNQGNIIFYGDINPKEMMNTDLPEIVGSKKDIYYNYRSISDKINTEVVFNNLINKERKYMMNDININNDNKTLLWYLRDYKNNDKYFNDLFKLEKEIYDIHENDRCITLLEKVIHLIKQCDNKQLIIQQYKCKKIISNELLILFNEINKVIMNIHNNIHYKKYLIIRKTCEELFTIINKMIFNFII